MTIEEFKILCPDKADLEGEALWNAMEDCMLECNSATHQLRNFLPFYKRYSLRWLFYRTKSFRLFIPDIESDKRCVKCKKGVGSYMAILMKGKIYATCPYCGEELKREPNTNLSYKLIKSWRKIQTVVEMVLDQSHILRRKNQDRYGTFGDENMYIKSWGYNMETGKTSFEFKKRKWWEYIVIDKHRN